MRRIRRIWGRRSQGRKTVNEVINVKYKKEDHKKNTRKCSLNLAITVIAEFT